MMKPKILLCLALVFSLVCAARVLVGDAAAMDTPKFSALEFPEPPSQHKPWTPPATDLPANLVSSAKVLFDLGLADPRDCEYREFETASGRVRGQTATVTAHGWILPARFGVKQSFAVGWDGVVYPVVLLGEKAIVEEDIQALLRADELWRKAAATNLFPFRMWQMLAPRGSLMSQTNMTPIKVALLLRLGEGKLAQDYWTAWCAVETMDALKEDANNAFRDFASEWTSAQFERAVRAFMRADDGLALADFRQLNRLWPALEKEASLRGFTQSLDENTRTRPYFGSLNLVPEFLADEERRAKEPPHPGVLDIGLDKFPEKSKRIAALISDLDQVSELQFMYPGRAWLGDSPLVAALVSEGDGAVEPLLDCLEKDPRLTRSVDMGNDRWPSRIVPVREGAQAALDGIFKTHFDSTEAYRAYWQESKACQLTLRNAITNAAAPWMVPFGSIGIMQYTVPADAANILESRPASELLPFLAELRTEPPAWKAGVVDEWIVIVRWGLRGTPSVLTNTMTTPEGVVDPMPDIPVYNYTDYYLQRRRETNQIVQ